MVSLMFSFLQSLSFYYLVLTLFIHYYSMKTIQSEADYILATEGFLISSKDIINPVPNTTPLF